jgi:hypothetical protein
VRVHAKSGGTSSDKENAVIRSGKAEEVTRDLASARYTLNPKVADVPLI